MNEVLLDAALKIAVGVVLRLTGLVKPDGARAINMVVLYAALPSLLFTSTSTLDFSAVATLKTAIVGCAVTAAALALSWLALPRLVPDRRTAGALMLGAPFGNTVYLGYPLISSLYGAAALRHAVAFDQLATIPLFVTLSAVVGSAFGSARAASAGTTAERTVPLKEILRFPPMWGTLCGLAWAAVVASPPSGTVARSLASVGSLTTPLMLLLLGMQLELPKRFREVLDPGLWFAMGIKLVLCPLIAFGVASLLRLPAEAIEVAALAAAMPTLLGAGVVVTRFGLDERVNTLLVTSSTLLALATLPLVRMLTSAALAR